MGILLYPAALCISTPSLSHFNVHGFYMSEKGRGSTHAIAFSSHSSPRILKHNRRSPYGQPLSPYDNGDGYDDDEDVEFDGEEAAVYMSSDDEFAETVLFNGNHHKQKASNFQSENRVTRKQGTCRLSKKRLLKEKPLEAGHNHSTYGSQNVKHGIRSMYSQNDHLARSKYDEMGFEKLDGGGRVKNVHITRGNFVQLSEDSDFDEKWFPLIEYLTTFGLKESHIIQMYERHMPCLKISAASAQERLEFFLSIGVKHGDIKRILMRQPQILEYTVENNLKPHVAFLKGLGIPDSRIGQIITSTPSLFSYNIEHSLKPTIRYLIEEVGIKESDLSKVVQLSPQILVLRIDNSWTTRFSFLSKELGAPRDSIVKMVTKHPQLLHYSIEDGILPRINFLRSIGMHNPEILKVLTSLTQVLSLSLERNLRPKYLYLVKELHNNVQSLTKYPMYLSLSLDQRIRPRHRFLVSLNKAPKGPFPLSSLVPTDECFCQHWAGTSIERYQAFRQTLLLSGFAKKYERKR